MACGVSMAFLLSGHSPPPYAAWKRRKPGQLRTGFVVVAGAEIPDNRMVLFLPPAGYNQGNTFAGHMNRS